MDKLCIITNSQFSWILEVDGVVVSFQGSHNADYFKTHYESLGYKVEMKEDQR